MKKVLALIIKTLLIIFLLLLIVISSVKLYEYNKGKIKNRALAESVIKTEETENSEKMVDFQMLLSENRDVIGWIYCENTPINYPIVQAKDNSYYVRRGIDGQYSYSGSLFADFRNSPDFSDKNTVIYGHNMKNSEMFGSLVNYKEQAYFDLHSEITLMTPGSSHKIALIAGFEEKSTAEFYEELVSFEKAEEMINSFILKSTFDSGYLYSENDRFVTLSTCTDDYSDIRFLVIGKIH